MSWSLIKQKKKDALAEEELITSNDENDPNNISLETNIEHSGEDVVDEA